MILGECFEKSSERSPVSVMVRGTLERVFDPEKLERVFTDHALLQYTRELTFAQCVGLMSDVVFRIVPSVGAWDKAHQDEIPVTRQAVYDKLKHLELPTAAGVVEYAGRELGACLQQMPAPPPPLLPGSARAGAGREPLSGDGAASGSTAPLSGCRPAWARAGFR